MTRLVPRVENDSPGLFVNPDWQPGTPGTFAVVIGASEYPYLVGGSEFREGDEAFTLGQLHVSAATARAFFEWLTTGYDFPAAPPAQCWLLLSPTVRELQAFGVPAVEDLGAAPATLANCELALRSWYEAMAQVPVRAVAISRSFFFFSGHGVEVEQDAQILLPSDYLRRPGRSVNDAISTANLLKGLASSTVTNHFLFADACRNDVPQVREYVLEGRPILNVRTAATTNPDALAGILYAAASGTPTWQPRELEQGLSLFGDALVHGLEGVEGIERQRCDGQHCEIQFYPLQTFVKARMAKLLTEFSSPEKARVRQGGSPPDGGITLVPDTGVPPPVPFSPTPALTARYDVVYTDLAWKPGDDWGAAHRIFGSERMTDIWDDGARAHDLGTGLEVPRREIVIREVRRSSDTKAFRIAVELPTSRHGHWLSFTDPREQHFAISLAGGNAQERPVYELTIDFELDEEAVDTSSRSVSTVEARLSPLSSGSLGRIADIWNAYETQNVAVAVRELDVDDVGAIVMRKLDSSLAATVAAVLLLRARRLDRVPAPWLANLSNWFPHNPDAPVLRAQRARLTAVGEPQHAVWLELVNRLTERGLPRLAELLPLAWRQLAELAEQPNTPWRLALYDQLRGVMRYHRPGGLFAVFASPTGPLDVGLVRPIEAEEVAGNPLEVFVAAFDNEEQAGDALKDFRAMDRVGSIELIDAAVIVRGADGKVRFEETADPSGKKWAKRGAIAGGLVGLIFPPSIIGTALVGAAGGGIWGKVRDKGFRDEDLKAIGETLAPGTSAIIAVAEDHVIERLQRGLEGYQKIATHAVSAEATAQIMAEAEGT